MTAASHPISEVSRITGIATSTLRYYEREGLIRPLARNGGKRVYGPDILTRLALIDLAKQAGFTITEIARAIDASTGAPGPGWREIAEPKLAELDAQIAFAQRAKTMLTHALDCPHPTFQECPVFEEALHGHIDAMRARNARHA